MNTEMLTRDFVPQNQDQKQEDNQAQNQDQKQEDNQAQNQDQKQEDNQAQKQQFKLSTSQREYIKKISHGYLQDWKDNSEYRYGKRNVFEASTMNLLLALLAEYDSLYQESLEKNLKGEKQQKQNYLDYTKSE